MDILRRARLCERADDRSCVRTRTPQTNDPVGQIREENQQEDLVVLGVPLP